MQSHESARQTRLLLQGPLRARAGQSTGTTPSETGDRALCCPHRGAAAGRIAQYVRRQIPALTVNGAVYSDNPAQRLLLVNGQVLSQGSAAAPDVTLEIIQSASSEFSFKGTRFRVAH